MMSEDRPTPSRPHPVEWGMATICAAMVVGIIAFLVHQAMIRSEDGPEITITATTTRPAGPGFVVEFVAENTGDSTAANVEIEGILTGPDGVAEEAGVTLNFLPSGSSRRGGLVFDANPADHDLQLAARGYTDP